MVDGYTAFSTDNTGRFDSRRTTAFRSVIFFVRNNEVAQGW